MQLSVLHRRALASVGETEEYRRQVAPSLCLRRKFNGAVCNDLRESTGE